jgi:uncharacterized membrane protein (DUF2068 family)
VASAGDPQRSRRVLRLIAAERIVRSLLLLAAGVYLLSHQSTDFGKLAEHVMRTVELDPRHGLFHRAVTYLHGLHASQIKIAGLFALGYGALELVEGTGLWLDKLWAEYLTVIATALLLPLEIVELVRKPSALKAAGIAVNVAIVVYLIVVLRRRLQREHAS